MAVGGAEKLVYDMVRYGSFADQKPVICCLDELGKLGEKLREQGYKIYIKNRKSGLDWDIIFWLRKIMRKECIEVVHAHQYTPLFYTVLAARLVSGLKVIYTEHGRFYPDRKSWKRSLINPLLALGVDHLVSISKATADAMAIYDNFSRKTIKIIHNGIDYSAMNPIFDESSKRLELGLDDKCRIIGTAARLNSIKNIPMMIRGLKIILQQEPDTILIIAGQGEEEDQLKGLAKDLEISDQVKFIGLRFDLAEIYPLFDVFLLTSFSEGISVTLLEAMASGVPAVVTDVGGNREVVVEGKSGILVPIDDDAMFAQQVCSLLQNKAFASLMGSYARLRIDNNFSVRKMMNSYRELYDQ